MKAEDVKKIAMIGAGDMGHGIAASCLLGGYTVVLRDIEQKFVDKGVAGIIKSLEKFRDKGKISPDVFAHSLVRLIPMVDLQEAVKDADFVIEAVPEKLELKKSVFAEIDQYAPKHAILASNTSNISITEIASATQRPDKVIGYHFFNPAVLMKLVEVIKGRGTSEGYVNSTLEQTDAGITQDFDFKPFTDGTFGYLPNDRRHTVKVFGAYELSDEWMVSGNLLVQSGRPQSCYGFIPLDDPSLNDSDVEQPVYDYYVASHWAGNSFYCRDEDGNQVLGHRGDRGRTPWIASLDTGIAYKPNWASQKLTFEFKVFNLLNTQRVTEYYEFSERGSSTDPEIDPNFMNTVNYQTPRSAQFSIRYEF